ncbi:MAG: hypothetical protein J6K77_07385, partial [Ruminococcus sp.]|nr:hypothetical protein [Ruminococcus sp.]
PQTLPEALPLDSAKGTLSLWKPGVIGFADLGLCPKPCQRRCLWTLPKGHCPFGNPVLSAAPIKSF